MKNILENIKHGSVFLRPAETRVTTTSGERFLEARAGGARIMLERAGEGFVVDTAPDPKLHLVRTGLFVGSADAASNEEGLAENGVTHVLCLAPGYPDLFPERIQYLHVDLLDVPEQALVTSLQELCVPFIRAGISSGGVLVHCNAGVSRSTAVCVGYLMITEKLTFEQAFGQVKHARPVANPNAGFREQLKSLEHALL